MGAIDLAQERCLRMIDDMLASGRWTQEDIGEKLGVSQAMVSFYVKRTNRPGLKAIANAMDALNVSPLYFFDATLRDPNWSDFVGVDDEPSGFDWRAYVSDSDSPGWRRFAERYLERFVAEGLSAEDVETLRSTPFYGGARPLPGVYVDHAEALLSKHRAVGTDELGDARREHKRKGGGQIRTGARKT